jgi:hypothetical protein
MKIKLLKNIGIDGQHTPAGSIVEVPRPLALDLIGAGRAVREDGKTEPTGGVISTESGLVPFPEDEATAEAPTGDAEPEPTDKPKRRGK